MKHGLKYVRGHNGQMEQANMVGETCKKGNRYNGWSGE